MTESSPKRRNFFAFLTGAADEEIPVEPAAPSSASSAPLYPPAGRRRPITRVARPVSATPAPAPTPPVMVEPDGNPGNVPFALPDHVAPPGTVLVAGVDADGVEYVFEDDPDAPPLVDPRYDYEDRNWVRYRTTWGSLLRVVALVLFLIWMVTTVRDRIYGWVDVQIVPDGEQGDLVEFTIPNGAATNSVATALVNQDIISNATVFRYWLRCEGDLNITGFLGCETETSFQAGDYELYENMSYENVVAVFAEGPAPEIFFNLTIPEGLRLNELVDRMLAKNDQFDRQEILVALENPDLISEYFEDSNLAEAVPLEGTLFPATYDIPEGDLANEARFLQRLADTFDQRFGSLLDELGRSNEIVELGLSDYDIIVVASLIEEEARVAVDRPLMARAIYNRLARGIRLEIDATVHYATSKPFTEKLTQSDLDAESPWNTRKTAGIPPTPIAAPGEAAMRAALAPADGDYIFWARTDHDGIVGAHTFSTTLDEHNQAVGVCRELGYCG